MNVRIPNEVEAIWEKLAEHRYRAYLVGGCVRDLIIGKAPKDWDITTSAKPDAITELFPDSVYENAFGTVLVKTGSDREGLKVVEVTPFRLEGKYSDHRHPDYVVFAESLEEDLRRRDFTINAMALSRDDEVIDLFGGREDVERKVIRAVGVPEQRFAEDPLRLMRAVRLAVELGFAIDVETQEAILKTAPTLALISKERVRDELMKTLETQRAAQGIDLMTRLGLTREILPELEACRGVTQNKHHIYDVYEHSLRALDYAAEHDFSLPLRLAALLHDVGKPRTKEGEGLNATFHQHQYAGEQLARRVLARLKFPKEIIDEVTLLVRHHMFYYNVDEVTLHGVRRFISRVGIENVDKLMLLRHADRIGSGVPKAQPYRLRHLLFMIEKARRDPVSPKMLAIGGNEVMAMTREPAGPFIGWVLKALLDEVLADPARNTTEYLTARARELAAMSRAELRQLAEESEQNVEEFESEVEGEMKKKHRV